MHLVISFTDIGYHKFFGVPMYDRTLCINPTKGIAFPKRTIDDVFDVADILLWVFWCEFTAVSHINNTNSYR